MSNDDKEQPDVYDCSDPTGQNLDQKLTTSLSIEANVKNNIAKSNPFSHLKLASFEPLYALENNRFVCNHCHRSRKFFCFSCNQILGPKTSLVPQLTLPIPCNIIHHATERQTKSTAWHAKVLASNSVRIIEYSDDSLNIWSQELESDETAILLYPSPDALDLADLDFSTVSSVFFIDSQWHNARRMLRDQRLAGLQRVKINNHVTNFWRWQKLGPECLATIETIYYFYKEYITTHNNGKYEGQVDNLMYYFVWMYQLIQNTYKSNGKEFRRIKNYIQS